MDALALLRDQVLSTDDLLTQVVSKVTPVQATWQLSGSTANPIAAAYLHVYHNEDRVIHGLLQGKALRFDAGNWQERVGVDAAKVWQSSSPTDLAALCAYAAEVHVATRDYLAGLEPTALEEDVQTQRGKRPCAEVLSLYLVRHKLIHLGEIAALLGCQGVKGLPV
jgi:hypothetical protein